jgi:hypothetical protein
MQFLKKIFQYLQKFFSWENWPYWLAILAIIGLFLLLWFLITRRREQEVKPVLEEPKQKVLPRSSLRDVWKEFLRGIPREFRRSIMLYQHYVVMGESGVGKSLLIDTYTDWQGQASQFYPSYTVNPLLQIYLGSEVIVQEIPAALLNDVSQPVRAALLKLWRPLFKRKSEPTVVAVLNGATLSTESSELLKRQAQMIRGKVNILSRLRKNPVKVSIALTHMDQIEGFLEFSHFLAQNNIPLTLAFGSQKELHTLENCLEPYEAHLTRALTSMPAETYVKIISFLRHAPELFSPLSVFIKFLQQPDPLSSEPEIVRLSLTSHKVKEGIISNPFVPSLPTRAPHPLRKHQLAAAAVVVLGICYLLGGYLYEYQLLKKADRDMASFEASPPPQFDEMTTKRLFLDFTLSLKKDPLLSFLPNFFPNASESIKQRGIRYIQKFYLFPDLKLLTEQGHKQEKVLYLLALIYASTHNELGTLVLGNSTEWSHHFGYPTAAIEDYVKNNDSFADIDLPLRELGLDRPEAMFPKPTLDLQRWLLYFQELQRLIQKPILTKKEAERLKKEADNLLASLKALADYRLSGKLCHLLKVETPCVVYQIDSLNQELIQLRQESLRQFLTFLREKDNSYPSAKELDISGLMKNIKAMRVLGAPKEQEFQKFQFKLASEEFIFTRGKWNELVINSRITWLMRDFVAHNKRHDGLLFFQSDKEFRDLVMNPSNDGRFFFTGRGIVDSRFTKIAFEQQVKPVLDELPQFLEDLAIPEDEKQRFSNFVYGEVSAYAERYISEFLHYYREFDVQVASLGEFRYVLTQMQMPTSEFQDFLLTMKENTQLDLGDNPYLRPFAIKLKEFGFIQRLMEERKGTHPELDKYKAILAQMEEDLESEEPIMAVEETDTAKELKRELSPLGRISLAIFLDEKDSYINMVNKWLKSVGGDKRGWQNPFLAPVYQAYELGLEEVQATIDRVWDDLWQSDVLPLVAKFPFNMNAESAVSAAELDAALNPQRGEFWTKFNKYLKPVFVETGGTWQKRTFPRGSFWISQDMLETINGLTRLSRTLWDEKGIAQPLTFSLKALPLPPVHEHDPAVVLAYLKSGKACIFAFNQQPAWQDFQLEWWKSEPASVGIEFASPDKSPKKYQVITVPQSNWSFYRLLQKSDPSSSDLITWRLQSPEIENRFLEVQFSIQSDPWAVFHLDQEEKKVEYDQQHAG